MLLGSVALLDANLRADLAQWNRYRQAYADALAAAADARKHFEAAGDVPRTASTLATEASIYLRRAGSKIYPRPSRPPRSAICRCRSRVRHADRIC